MKVIPFVHWDVTVKKQGRLYYLAEITTNAGTHGIYLDKERVDKGEIELRNRK
ncbi:hypothetical protein KY342_00975 [Candidatus Woesearchaeota archaeon]|nr:hypothetical protein [Candidatus Woesearchaeota archaeon]